MPPPPPPPLFHFQSSFTCSGELNPRSNGDTGGCYNHTEPEAGPLKQPRRRTHQYDVSDHVAHGDGVGPEVRLVIIAHHHVTDGAKEDPVEV